MPAEKKDRHTAADISSADSPGTVSPKRRSPDRSAPVQLLAPFPEQNPAGPQRACSPERTSERAIRSACCSSSPDQKPASDIRASPGVPASAAFPATSAGYKAAGPTEIAPAVRSPAEYCRI